MAFSATNRVDERIDEELIESFPASDPPSWTLGGWNEGQAAGAKGDSKVSTHAGLAVPIVVRDLTTIAEQLRGQATYRERGHNASTLVKHADQRVVLLVVGAGARIHEHKAAGAASIHVLSGRTRLRVGADEIELGAGQLIALEGGVPHDVQGVEDATLLITLSWASASTKE